jgi:hypothetical protein
MSETDLPPLNDPANPHINFAFVGSGRVKAIAQYLREVADSIERGGRNGMSGRAASADFRWFTD